MAAHALGTGCSGPHYGDSQPKATKPQFVVICRGIEGINLGPRDQQHSIKMDPADPRTGHFDFEELDLLVFY